MEIPLMPMGQKNSLMICGKKGLSGLQTKHSYGTIKGLEIGHCNLVTHSILFARIKAWTKAEKEHLEQVVELVIKSLKIQ